MNLLRDDAFIESINACGPFNHSHWDGKGISVSHEEGLRGRADFLVGRIREILTNSFTKAEMSRMSIADVGCYDGWILHQLSDLPFKTMVGIEPRKKNISKGKEVRKLLGIESRVRFRQGALESLGRQRYDVVLCLGVLHHVEAISIALKELDRITRKMLILTSICMPSRHITKDMRRDLEPKDIIYQTRSLCGFTAQKYESSYYDGSAATTSVVSVPSIETLQMHLDLLGYDAKVQVSPDGFRRARPRDVRGFDEVLLSCVRSARQSFERDISEYERGMMEPVSRSLVEPLYRYFVRGEKRVNWTKEAREVRIYLDKGGSPPRVKGGRYANEIVKNLRWNPIDKICLEYAKVLYAERLYSEASVVLRHITQTLNADWRSVYRAFYLLSKVHDALGDRRAAQRYLKLCGKCNPEFPLLAEFRSVTL